MTETIHTLIIGGGQAGVATSTHLQKLGVPHLVLERARIAERSREVYALNYPDSSPERRAVERAWWKLW